MIMQRNNRQGGHAKNSYLQKRKIINQTSVMIPDIKPRYCKNCWLWINLMLSYETWYLQRSFHIHVNASIWSVVTVEVSRYAQALYQTSYEPLVPPVQDQHLMAWFFLKHFVKGHYKNLSWTGKLLCGKIKIIWHKKS